MMPPEKQKTDSRPTLHDLSKATGRSQNWHAAVERGELLPTRLQFFQLDDAYPETGRAPEDVLRDLDDEPWGKRAEELRSEYDLKNPEPGGLEADEATADGVFPILDEVTRYERLFILGPMMLLAWLIILTFYMRPFSGDGPLLVWPDLEATLFLGTTFLGLGVLFSNRIGTVFAKSCSAVRTQFVSSFTTSFDELREIERIRIDPRTNWFQAAELQHMPVAIRPTVRLVSIKTEVAERVSLVFATGAILLLAIFGYAAIADPARSTPEKVVGLVATTQIDDTSTTNVDEPPPPLGSEEGDAEAEAVLPTTSATIIWLLAATVLTGLATFAGRSSQSSARRLAGYLTVGLGLTIEVDIAGNLSLAQPDPG